MKGDKNRGEKLFAKIVSGDKFQQGVFDIRSNLKINIPENGYEETPKRYSERVSKKLDKLISLFLKEQNLSENTWWNKKIFEYILFNGKIEIHPPLSPTQQPFIEVIHKKNIRNAFTDLRLFPGITQKEIISFIKDKDNWKFIKPIYRLGTTEKIRSVENPRLKALIDGQWDKSRKELGMVHDESKEILICRILKEEYPSLSSENVKAIHYRSKRKQR